MNITISKEDHYTGFNVDNFYPMEGALIKMKWKKRYYAKVLGISAPNVLERVLRCKIIYKPAPKSTLKKKSVFSKFKTSILNH